MLYFSDISTMPILLGYIYIRDETTGKKIHVWQQNSLLFFYKELILLITKISSRIWHIILIILIKIIHVSMHGIL